MAQIYAQYCPVAHALELVGDRWSLLIIRDLLQKPQRFTDLLHYSSNITPKWLTARLRQLEQAGIIEREKHENRREVWYKLTPAGQGNDYFGGLAEQARLENTKTGNLVIRFPAGRSLYRIF